MKRITTCQNCSDSLTKQTGKKLIYRQFDYVMGKVVPQYVKAIPQGQMNVLMNHDYIKYMQHDKMIQFPIL